MNRRICFALVITIAATAVTTLASRPPGDNAGASDKKEIVARYFAAINDTDEREARLCVTRDMYYFTEQLLILTRSGFRVGHEFAAEDDATATVRYWFEYTGIPRVAVVAKLYFDGNKICFVEWLPVWGEASP